MSGTNPPPTPPLWGSITDVKGLATSPALAGDTVRHIFGDKASSVAAWCAIYARQDGDEQGYRLWLAAFKHITAFDLKLST